MSKKIVKTRDEVLKAIELSGGMVKEMAVLLGCGRDIVYKLLKENDLADELAEARLDLTQLALETVKSNIDTPEVALKYLAYAKSLGAINLQVNADNIVVKVGNVGDKDELDKFTNE